jgi:hypothetical protein
MNLARILWTSALLAPTAVLGASAQLLGWNNLGMHCMDSDYSVFSILPPYNTIEAQLIVAGKLVTNAAGYTLTIGEPIRLTSTRSEAGLVISWPLSLADALLEGSSELGPAAQWTAITNLVSIEAGSFRVTLPASGAGFLRLRRLW